jgi:hypothetical protein
MLARKGNYER